MSKINLVIYSVVLIISLVFAYTVHCEKGAIDIFKAENENISDWHEGWAGEPIEATIEIKKDEAIIEGATQDKAFGSVHKNMTIDLDRYSVIKIDVKSVSYYWYLIVSGEQFHFDPTNPRLADGYALLQESTNKTGKYKYDLKKITGLSGKQNFDLQIGVGRFSGDGNIGCKAVIKSLRFIQID